jgi:hypothetical protein
MLDAGHRWTREVGEISGLFIRAEKTVGRLATLESGAHFSPPNIAAWSYYHLILRVILRVRPRQQIGGNHHHNLPSSLQVDHQSKLRRPDELSTSFDPNRNAAPRRTGPPFPR